MKKLHFFVLRTILGPFTITLTVLVFIFLIQFLMNYMDELAGKGVGIAFFAELSFYFIPKMVIKALPLAVLFSSLMAYGNLGQFNELTAIKSSGISLTRIMFSSFLFATFIALSSFCINNFLVPKSNLKAYSLFHDIRNKKATFDLEEKAFYSQIPGYSIRVDKKYEDGKSLKNVIVYKHTNGRGNKEVIVADSGRMEMFNNDRYLKFSLFNGNRNSEVERERNYGQQARGKEGYAVTAFDSSQIVFDMSSFFKESTPQELFKKDRRMLMMHQLFVFVDSLENKEVKLNNNALHTIKKQHVYYDKSDDEKTKRERVKKVTQEEYVLDDDTLQIDDEETEQDLAEIREQEQKDKQELDSLMASLSPNQKTKVLSHAVTHTNNYINTLQSAETRSKDLRKNKNKYKIALLEKITSAIACLAMFLIGAPIGSIIKKGGLGIPILIGISFFIFYYMFSEYVRISGREGFIMPELGMWLPNASLVLISFWFLDKARKDTSLFELDRYIVFFERLYGRFKR